MILRNIDNQELQDLDFNVFVDFFTEHLFFKFMDGGRESLVAGYKDLVDTSFYRAERVFIKNHSKGKNVKCDVPLVQTELYEGVYNYGLQRVVSGFIKSGTSGMREAVFMVASDPRIFQQ
jgi:hypothetical protein